MLLFFLYPRVTKPCDNNQLVPVINQTSLTLSAVQNTIAVAHNTRQRLPDLVVIDPHVNYTVSKSVGYNEGVVNQDFIFLNTLANNANNFNQNNNPNTFYPESVKLCKFQKSNCHTKDLAQYEYQPKNILAFYNTKLCMGTTSEDLFFCIATELFNQGSRYKVYLVLPAYIKYQTQEHLEQFFTEPNKYQNVMSLKDLKNKDCIFNQPKYDTKVLKIHLYMPKINDLSNVIFYAFLLNQCNMLTNSIDIARFFSMESFKKIHSIDATFVKNKINQYFNTNIADLFYMLYTKQNHNKNQARLLKESLSNTDCRIVILDTLCKEDAAFIKAEFLIKIMLSSTVANFDNVATVPHFYGLFTICLSLKPEAYKDTLECASTFFTIPCTDPNGFNQVLFFAHDTNAMPRNDVRTIKVVASTQNNDSDTNNPIVEIITGVNEHGFMTTKYANNDVPQLSYNDHSNQLALTLPAHHSNETYVNQNITFSSTELLTVLLDNVTKKPTAKQSPKTNASTSFEHLITFASGLIQKIEILEKHIHSLEKQITNLSIQHNDLFAIKKEIIAKKQDLDTVLSRVQELKNDLNKLKNNNITEFKEQSEKLVSVNINTLAQKQKELLEELKNVEQKVTTLIKDLASQQDALTKSQRELDEKIKKLNPEFLVKQCELNLADNIKNNNETMNNFQHSIKNSISSIENLNKAKLNYFLTSIGCVSVIGVFALYWYLCQLHARINALESFINQSVTS